MLQIKPAFNRLRNNKSGGIVADSPAPRPMGTAHCELLNFNAETQVQKQPLQPFQLGERARVTWQKRGGMVTTMKTPIDAWAYGFAAIA